MPGYLPQPPSLPQFSPPPGRHTHTCTDSLTMSLRVWLCCGQGDQCGVGGRGGDPPAPPCPPPSAHLSGLVQRQADGDGGDEEDAEGVPVVVVRQPQPDAEGLEPIVGVQCLREGRVAVSQPVALGAATRSKGTKSCHRPIARHFSWSVPADGPRTPSFFILKRTLAFTCPASEKYFI